MASPRFTRAIVSLRGASPLGLPYTRPRSPLRRLAPGSWLARFARVEILALLAVLAAGCEVKPAPGGDVASWRAEKDRFMRSAESPVPQDRRPSFPPLVYFPIDSAYQVPAALTVLPGSDALELPTSTGLRRKMRRIGTLRFTLQQQELTLAAFVDAESNDMRRLFVPFGDLTNGNETYPGGRYMDLDRTATGIYDLDFNRAYNPFCVFNEKYDCPLPPRENRLTVPIRAGERLGKPGQPNG